MNKELLSIKIKLNNIVKDILSVYGLKQEGKWVYAPTILNSYYDLITNNRLGVFKYRLRNSEGKINIYITNKYDIIVEDGMKFLAELPKKVDTLTENEFITLKDFILQSTNILDIEEILNNKTEIDLQAIYGSKCNESTINNIRIIEEALLNNQITIYDMKDFYEKCHQVRNFENKEVQWTFRLKLDDGKGNLLKTTYIDVFFIGKTSKRIVVVCKDIVTEQEYTLNIEVGKFAESVSEQWRDIYEL
ncbi:hypothetical protein FNU3_117 [Fusobacterium phage vB_FnuS_FNU3]|uniref:Uncharacterized protein n=1 Tax=Fusobacterium phage Fnu1 TaxID=2530024 RepID=A0A481W6S6_9CAUD|nr:hypothetical protein KMD24_gp090 [Fusobacterium phage Fnu1]QBJ04101.1 hypothetical protein [Fusobacterium phage Fnu1]WGH50229.1 hypothetical protein FNU2_12 [Fusobacterium phage vB_FnuS_FNU2]WGH50375.1 hypothetical protein FNU3_117 [Fusobacterium phage vB_FnuS_FNU3]